jgi:Na+/melibiose symporter-like transporter
VYWFVISTLGLAIGPFAVAAVTDGVFQDEAAVGKSLALVAGVFGVLVTWILVYVLKPYRESVAEAEAGHPAAVPG